MPAVTVDTLTLPRIHPPDRATTTWRGVDRVVTARRAVEGEGFVVRRPFPGVLSMREADPFLLLDHMGSVELAPGQARGTGWHPHRGFETVTYLLDGALEHQDSTGGGGLIANGATQWMTAGRGILHIERPPESFVRSGGVLHGVQLWVNLPRDLKLVEPRYQDLEPWSVTLASTPDGGALLRVIAGDLAGHEGPGRTRTPITYVHATVAPGARVEVPWPADFNAMVYVLAGDALVGPGDEPAPLGEAQLALLGPGGGIVLRAAETQPLAARDGLDVLLLGGRPNGEPIEHYGPFVMNTRAEIVQALEDFQAGRLGW
jgi:redox-sensitive bicupin YhaK (pirin superfamily)